MTDLAVGSGDIALDADTDEASRIGEYLASHGGPFFELQRRLGVLREDALLAGRNLAANDAAETTAPPVPDTSAQFAASRKLSIFLMSRSAIAPLASAALVPFAIAGATKLPYKEVFTLVKKLLVL